MLVHFERHFQIEKNVCLPYLKFSDTHTYFFRQTHLFFIWPNNIEYIKASSNKTTCAPQAKTDQHGHLQL